MDAGGKEVLGENMAWRKEEEEKKCVDGGREGRGKKTLEIKLHKILQLVLAQFAR